MKTILRIIFILALVGIFSTIFFFPISEQQPEQKEVKIVTTIFPAYDFARTLSQDTNVNVSMLLKPGSDLHNYEPSPQDIIKIKEADIFIYNGGESESWINDILKEIDHDNVVTLRMMDAVELKEESTNNILDNKEEETLEPKEYDEHIWTNPKNAIKISEKIAQALINRSPDDTSVIQRNLDKFKEELNALHKDFKKLAKEKTGTLIVADRFPFSYFIADYNFDYIAAFPGCAEQTEASAKTITELDKAIKQNPEKVIFTLELSNAKIAQTLAKNNKAKILTWHSAHNISQKDFDNNVSYLEIMKNNLNNLSEALHDRPESNES